MRRHLGLVALLALGGTVGCKDSKPTGSAVTPSGGSGGDDGSTDDGTDDGSDGGTDDGGDEGGEDDISYSFEDPGDVVPFEDEEGTALVDLSDETGDESNKDNEFLLVLINTSSSSYGYELRYTEAPEDDDTGGGAEGPAGPLASPSPAVAQPLSPYRQRLRDARREGRLAAATPPPTPPPAFGTSDIGEARQQFQVRDSIDDEDSTEPVDATLWAVGSYVNIWVDDGWPIDFDADCDGTPERIHPAGAFGFDNCDLALIADAIDANIHPTMASIFGEVPDVNGDGKVTVVITPNLNQMTTFLDEEDDSYGEVVRSYVDPEVDLTDFDASDNPNSNEQEVIFVFAPDESGAVNPGARTSVDSYTEVELLAEVARGYQRLISYKYHVIDTGSEDGETTWVQEGLSALAADLTGFGSVYYDDVWDYLDAPHITPLVDESDLEVINTDQWGAQYLFFRWLYEHAGDLATLGQEDDEGGGGADTGGSGLTGNELVAQLVQSSDTGTDNITSVTGLSMEELVLYWQVSMAVAGRENAAGDPLVDEGDWPPYDDATFVTAPTESPSAGDLYGANGYQQGVNLAGINLFMEGGFSSDGSEENETRRVTTSGLDLSTMVTGFNYFGYVEANYATQVTRLSDIPYDSGALLIDALGTGFMGVIVRLEDPVSPDYIVENIFSSTDATDIPLQSLPADGTPIRALGAIQDKGASFIRGTGDSEELVPVYDTDRFLLDLSDRAPTDTVKVSVHLERRYVDRNGTVGPSDPWLSVVPKSLVPHPTISTINSASCSGHPITFAYPSSVIEYLYYQLFLSSDAVGTDFEEDDEEEDSGGEAGGEGDGGEDGEGEGAQDFDPCGTIVEDDSGTPATLDCTSDFDLDGVADENEALPTTFLQQVQVMQCSAYGRGNFTAVGSEIIDFDHTDEDEESYYDRAANLGGLFGDDGEEAYLEMSLEGGAEYLVIVGAGDDTGPYELTIQQVD